MSDSIFERVTKAAISDLIERCSSPSKFGRLMSADESEELRDEFFNLIVTSRTLKSSGDRLVQKLGSNQATVRSPKFSPTGKNFDR